MADEVKTFKPPYMGYETFKNAVVELSKASHLPSRVDNSVFPTMSGSGKSNLIQALKFFRLIDELGVPSTEFVQLCGAASDSAKWKAAWATILPKQYSKQLTELESGTVATFKDSFGDIGGVSLVAPAARFLLQAARDAGLKVSTHIKEIPGAPSKKKKEGSNNGEGEGGSPPPPAAAAAAAAGRSQLSEEMSYPIGRERWLRVPKDLTARDCAMIKAMIPVLDEYVKQMEQGDD